jgi:hypothetical protein
LLFSQADEMIRGAKSDFRRLVLVGLPTETTFQREHMKGKIGHADRDISPAVLAVHKKALLGSEAPEEPRDQAFPCSL